MTYAARRRSANTPLNISPVAYNLYWTPSHSIFVLTLLTNRPPMTDMSDVATDNSSSVTDNFLIFKHYLSAQFIFSPPPRGGYGDTHNAPWNRLLRQKS